MYINIPTYLANIIMILLHGLLMVMCPSCGFLPKQALKSAYSVCDYYRMNTFE